MNGLQIRMVVTNVMARIKQGMLAIKADCSTKGKSDYRRELCVLADEADFHVIVLSLCGALNMIRNSSDGAEYHTEVQTELRVVFYVNTVRITAEYNSETSEIHFVFTDRRDESEKASKIATEHLSRIMGLGEYPVT